MNIDTIKVLEEVLKNLSDEKFSATFTRNSMTSSDIDINLFKDKKETLAISVCKLDRTFDIDLEPVTLFNIRSALSGLKIPDSNRVYQVLTNALHDSGFSLEYVGVLDRVLMYINPTCDSHVLVRI